MRLPFFYCLLSSALVVSGFAGLRCYSCSGKDSDVCMSNPTGGAKTAACSRGALCFTVRKETPVRSGVKVTVKRECRRPGAEHPAPADDGSRYFTDSCSTDLCNSAAVAPHTTTTTKAPVRTTASNNKNKRLRCYSCNGRNADACVTNPAQGARIITCKANSVCATKRTEATSSSGMVVAVRRECQPASVATAAGGASSSGGSGHAGASVNVQTCSLDLCNSGSGSAVTAAATSQVRQTIDSIATRIFGGGSSGGASLRPANANWNSGIGSSSGGVSAGSSGANWNSGIGSSSGGVSSGSSSANWNSGIGSSYGGVSAGSSSANWNSGIGSSSGGVSSGSSGANWNSGIGGSSGGVSSGSSGANWNSGIGSSSGGASLGPGTVNWQNSRTAGNSGGVSAGSSAVNWQSSALGGSSGGVTVGSTSVTWQKPGVGSILDSWLG